MPRVLFNSIKHPVGEGQPWHHKETSGKLGGQHSLIYVSEGDNPTGRGLWVHGCFQKISNLVSERWGDIKQASTFLTWEMGAREFPLQRTK